MVKAKVSKNRKNRGADIVAHVLVTLAPKPAWKIVSG
jgi:hypothetical protein